MIPQRLLDNLYGDSSKLLKLQASRKRKQMIFGMFFSSILGYKLGQYLSIKENNEEFLTEFESEDQIFHLAKTDKPIFICYFVPAHPWHYMFRSGFLKGAKEFHKTAHFMYINCAKHFDVCRSKKFEAIPSVELWKRNQNSPTGFEIIKYRKDFSYEGVEAFFEENDLTQKKVDTNRKMFAHHSNLLELKFEEN